MTTCLPSSAGIASTLPNGCARIFEISTIILSIMPSLYRYLCGHESLILISSHVVPCSVVVEDSPSSYLSAAFAVDMGFPILDILRRVCAIWRDLLLSDA